jgi:hypothetical protein
MSATTIGHDTAPASAAAPRAYELLDRIGRGRDFAVRDDQHDFAALLDATESARVRGVRLSLIDTARFSVPELEWLAETGARLLTSDETRPLAADLERLAAAGRRSGAVAAVLVRGAALAGGAAAEELGGLAALGLDLHASSREAARDLDILGRLAESARRGRACFVYYHHGPFVPELAGLAARGAWIHLSDRAFDGPADPERIPALARAAKSSGARLVLRVERGLSPEAFAAALGAGARLLIATPTDDPRSPLRPLERRARRRRLPARAFYLDTTFLL